MIKKVKFVWEKGLACLTVGKVYDVYDVKEDYVKDHLGHTYTYNNIDIYNDLGGLCTLYMAIMEDIYFIDVTEEYRNDGIDGILK